MSFGPSWMNLDRAQHLSCGVLMMLFGLASQTTPLDQDILRIGEQLTVMVYLKDEERRLDVAVRDCWAYGEPEFSDPDTPSLQLTNTNGCPT